MFAEAGCGQLYSVVLGADPVILVGSISGSFLCQVAVNDLCDPLTRALIRSKFLHDQYFSPWQAIPNTYGHRYRMFSVRIQSPQRIDPIVCCNHLIILAGPLSPPNLFLYSNVKIDQQIVSNRQAHISRSYS